MTHGRQSPLDTNLDGVIGVTEGAQERADIYAEQLATQLRKGFLAYCVLCICRGTAKYTSDIIQRLRETNLIVTEGTIYPLLNRLQKDGLLEHEWQESEQGPPRKYYKVTAFGERIINQTAKKVKDLNKTLEEL